MVKKRKKIRRRLKIVCNISRVLAVFMVLFWLQAVLHFPLRVNMLWEWALPLGLIAILMASFSRMQFIVVLGMVFAGLYGILSGLMSYTMAMETGNPAVLFTMPLWLNVIFFLVSLSFWLALFCRWWELRLTKKRTCKQIY